jgi:hypothetical protein
MGGTQSQCGPFNSSYTPTSCRELQNLLPRPQAALSPYASRRSAVRNINDITISRVHVATQWDHSSIHHVAPNITYLNNPITYNAHLPLAQIRLMSTELTQSVLHKFSVGWLVVNLQADMLFYLTLRLERTDRIELVPRDLVVSMIAFYLNGYDFHYKRCH